MKSRLHYSVAIIAVAFFTAIFYADDKAVSVSPKSERLSKDNLIELAIKYSGFDISNDRIKSLSDQIRYILDDFNNIPMIDSLIRKDTIAIVKIKDVELANGKREIVRDFDVYLHPISGKLLKIESISNEVGTSDTLPEPSIEKADRYLGNIGIVFTGLPDMHPQLNLYEALKKCPYNPILSKKIKAIYINSTMNGRKYDNCWIIMLHGTESLVTYSFPNADKIPVYFRNSIWVVISAENGELLEMFTAPRDSEYIRKHNLDRH